MRCLRRVLFRYWLIGCGLFLIWVWLCSLVFSVLECDLLVGFGCFVVLDLIQFELAGVSSLGFCLVWPFVCLIWRHVLFLLSVKL